MHGGLGRRLRAGALEVPQVVGAVAVGFALPELMIVVVLLGVLAGVAYGAQVNALDRVRSAVARFYVASQARACSYGLVSGDGCRQTVYPEGMELSPALDWGTICDFDVSFTAAWGGDAWTATIGSGGSVLVAAEGTASTGNSQGGGSGNGRGGGSGNGRGGGSGNGRGGGSGNG